mgnify:CR=1 FL=1
MADQYLLWIHLEQVENGQFLATSDEMPGLVAHGRTIGETMEIARDVARRLVESYQEHGDSLPVGLRRIGTGTELGIAVTA